MRFFSFQFCSIDANVTILPAYPLCDVAENLTLSCTLHQENFRQWTNSWSHWINKIFIRNVSGIIKGNTSFIYFPFCDYQDFGTYECNWVLQNRHGITSVFVLVNGKQYFTFLIIRKYHKNHYNHILSSLVVIQDNIYMR